MLCWLQCPCVSAWPFMSGHACMRNVFSDVVAVVVGGALFFPSLKWVTMVTALAVLAVGYSAPLPCLSTL